MEPLPAREITTDQLRLFSQVTGRTRDISVVVGEETLRLEFLAEPVPHSLERAVKVGIGRSHVWVGLSGFSAISAVRQILDDRQLSELPAEVQTAVLEAAFQPILDQLEALCGEPLTVLEVAPPEAMENLDLELGFSLSPETGQPVLGRMALPRETASILLQMIEHAPPVPRVDLSEVPVRAAVEIGTGSLSIGQLRQLEAFDVVLMDTSTLSQENQVRMRLAQSLICQAVLEESELTVQAIDRWTPEESPAPGTDEEQEQVDPAALGEETTVDLTFEWGEVCLSLGELAALSPGDALPFEADPKRPVNLRANGRRVGRGQLVHVGDRVGVRLEELG